MAKKKKKRKAIHIVHLSSEFSNNSICCYLGADFLMWEVKTTTTLKLFTHGDKGELRQSTPFWGTVISHQWSTLLSIDKIFPIVLYLAKGRYQL